ncbi:protein translocase subunit SecF [Cohnella nanjingensis]|uniref:Protein-export membrane protein SecF n=1 Tax=Cohnella nanjingensis TaxID=1387779 RepID=A0A7X0VHU4_9BACL|nr:protein translocase subunit SecF [Cohnella nanjingensis]MBB6674276.1 protein translocase subunit SecF [Cohnella nanjingensis]
MRYKFHDFDFMKWSKPFMVASIVIVLVGILSLSIFGLNYGIDFQAGTSVDISVTKPVDDAKVKQFLQDENLGDYTPTIAAERISVRFKHALTEVEQAKLENDFKKQFDEKASFEKNIVDVDIAKEQQVNALRGILIASLGIIIYIAIRFEWRFALASVIALLYDAFIVITLFSIFRLEVNLPFIVAVLTIIGYSINDTVVIFDRIRENLRFAKIKSEADLAKVVNDSILQTLTRSINTVVTVAFAALCLYIFGSESIKMFSLAMIFGLISGAYSSIFIASPLWFWMKRRAKPNKPVKAQTAT